MDANCYVYIIMYTCTYWFTYKWSQYRQLEMWTIDTEIPFSEKSEHGNLHKLKSNQFTNYTCNIQKNKRKKNNRMCRINYRQNVTRNHMATIDQQVLTSKLLRGGYSIFFKISGRFISLSLFMLWRWLRCQNVAL